jgi:hypothetical protein
VACLPAQHPCQLDRYTRCPIQCVLIPHLSISSFPYAPSGLAPCPACAQQTFAEERDHQDRCAKACHHKQRSYNATSNYIPNDLDGNFEDNNNLNIYPRGTIFHAPDSAIGQLLLARIKQAQEPLLPCKLTAPISHPLPPRLLLQHIAPAPSPHASTCSIVPQLSSLDQLNCVLILKSRLEAVYHRLNPLFKWHSLFVQQPLNVQDHVHKLGNQLKWCLANTHTLANRPRTQYKAVLHGCATIGHISFENYTHNLLHIACNIADLSKQGYFGVFLNMRRG